MNTITHSQKALPYSYDALEPHIDAATLELHYSKHHASYVAGLNAAEQKLTQARESGDFSSVKHLRREIAFHGSGHILHTLYWDSMAPNTSEKPQGALLSAIEEKFGSFETFEKEFQQTAATVEGSGWALLGVIDGRLEIYAVEKHQDLTQWGATPILACDVWEHAYYLKYQNKRPDYIQGFWKVVNWENVERLYNACV